MFSKYIAKAIRYRECRLQDNLHDDKWGLEDQSMHSSVQAKPGDPKDFLEHEGLPDEWYFKDGAEVINQYVSSASTRIACDPRLRVYAQNNASYANEEEVETAIENNPVLWQNSIDVSSFFLV